MGKYERVCRCKKCGKIYPHGIPYICGKCGTEIGTKTPIILKEMGLGYSDVILTDNCEKVIAKKTLLGWKIREDEAE